MKRIPELIYAVRNRFSKDKFFANFEKSCVETPIVARHYGFYERALATLDDESWEILKEKAIKHFPDHRKGQLEQGFFNQLNEAFAYRHLIQPFRPLKFYGEKYMGLDVHQEDDLEIMQVCAQAVPMLNDRELL